MRRLILLRHAKSSWDQDDLPDRLRPLAQRGRLAAPLMGAWLADVGLVPDAVLCSDSVRARETWDRLRPLLPRAPLVQFRERLYHAAPRTLLMETRAAPPQARALMLIGHEPGLGGFLRRLVPDPVEPDLARAFEKFPTAAVAVVGFRIDSWADLGFQTGALTRFAVPRDLV